MRGRGAPLAPLWVIVPTVVLLILQLALDGTSILGTRLGALREDSLLGAPGRVDARLGHAERDERPPGPPRELRMALWGAFLVALVYALGFLAAVPLYLAPYLRTEARLSWGRTLMVTALTAGFFYVVFGLLLDVRFPVGAIG